MLSANTFASSIPPPENTRIDQLVAALDQQRIGEGASSWVAQVLGVHTEGPDLWVQVAPADAPTEGVVLRLSAWATPQHALAALLAMRSRRGSLPHIIDVMQPA